MVVIKPVASEDEYYALGADSAAAAPPGNCCWSGAHHELTLASWLFADHAAISEHAQAAIALDRRLGAPRPRAAVRVPAGDHHAARR